MSCYRICEKKKTLNYKVQRFFYSLVSRDHLYYAYRKQSKPNVTTRTLQKISGFYALCCMHLGSNGIVNRLNLFSYQTELPSEEVEFICRTFSS